MGRKIVSKSTKAIVSSYNPKIFYEQLNTVRKRHKLENWVQFENMLGVRGVITRWKRGVVPSAESLLLIASTFNVSIDWLLTGYKPEEPKILQPIITIAGDNFAIPRGAYKDEYVAVPLVDPSIVAVYDGPIPHNFIKSLVWVYEPDMGERKFHNLRAVRISDDQAAAMQRLFKSGDILIIDPLAKPPYQPLSLKSVYAVRLESEKDRFAVRRVREKEDYWVFVADNPEYDAVVLKKTVKDNPIIGMVVAVWKNLLPENAV